MLLEGAFRGLLMVCDFHGLAQQLHKSESKERMFFADVCASRVGDL